MSQKYDTDNEKKNWKFLNFCGLSTESFLLNLSSLAIPVKVSYKRVSYIKNKLSVPLCRPCLSARCHTDLIKPGAGVTLIK